MKIIDSIKRQVDIEVAVTKQGCTKQGVKEHFHNFVPKTDLQTVAAVLAPIPYAAVKSFSLYADRRREISNQFKDGLR